MPRLVRFTQRRPAATAVVGATLLVLGALAYDEWLERRLSPDQRKYYRVKDGMTEREVEAVMGGPACMYDGARTYHRRTLIRFSFADGSSRDEWYFEGCEIIVYFDKSGLVHFKEMTPSPPRRIKDYVREVAQKVSDEFRRLPRRLKSGK